MAIVLAIHEIEDVAKFWAAVRGELPFAGIARLDALYPLVNGAKAVSLWDGSSADVVGDLVDARLGEFGSSEFYEVDLERAEWPSQQGRSTQEEESR